MINSKIKSARGISLVSLIIATLVLIILANVIIYNVKDDLKLTKLTEMQTDIANLKDKISLYYKQNGKIPASIKYTNISSIQKAGIISEAVDTGDFLVIDLSALENLTLNKGEDFQKVMENPENADMYTDLYIINETSHNIFYVAGVKVDQDIYYTDYTSDEVDTASVDLKYIDNVKVPKGFYYVSGTKDTGIIIKSDDNTQEYQWISKDKQISEIPNDINIDADKKEDFIKSVNGYQGYYKSTKDNEVIYLELENWSPSYDTEGTYKDKNDNIVYIPKGFSVSETPGENTLDEGLVIKDSNNNEWVWIEVPKSIYTTAQSNEDYEKIEKDMQVYVSDYRDSNHTDTWYSKEQHGFINADEYNNCKNSMLKSVYDNGGFYIGRYEVGTNSIRASVEATESTPMIQRDAYPYNYVTCAQAQDLSKKLSIEGRTTSLMFGIQWDLVLKYLETKGSKVQNDVKTNSITWGNYLNSTFDITRNNVKYTLTPDTATNWKTVGTNYTKLDSANVLLTTGATNRNSMLNIYDLAGNVWEWTLEATNDSSKPCTVRSGSSHDNAGNYPAGSRFDDSFSDANYSLGFRVALY